MRIKKQGGFISDLVFFFGALIGSLRRNITAGRFEGGGALAGFAGEAPASPVKRYPG